MQIPFTALLLCNDAEALGAIESTFEEYGVPAYYCPSGRAAKGSLSRRKFDLMVLDFDDPDAASLVDFHAMDARGIPSVIIALANDPSHLKQMLSRRVHFTIQKPLTASLVARTLKAAYSMIVAEKRVSFRHSVRIKAHASVLENNVLRPLNSAVIRDVSHTGLGIQTDSAVPRDATIFVDFELPEDGEAIHTIGKVIWINDQKQIGVQFRFVAPLEMRSLRSWLGAHCPWDVELEPRMMSVPTLLTGDRSGTIH